MINDEKNIFHTKKVKYTIHVYTSKQEIGQLVYNKICKC